MACRRDSGLLPCFWESAGQGLVQASVWWGISLPSADLHILSLSSRGSFGAPGPCDWEQQVGLWVHHEGLLPCALPARPNSGLTSLLSARMLRRRATAGGWDVAPELDVFPDTKPSFVCFSSI